VSTPDRPTFIDSYSSVQALRRMQPTDGSAEKTDETAPSAERVPLTAKIRHTTVPPRFDITCYLCGYSFVVTGRLEKVLCHKCRRFLQSDNHTIDTPGWTGAIQTVGTVVVAPGAVIKGGVVDALDLEVRGKVTGGTIRVQRRIEIFPGSNPNVSLLSARDWVLHPETQLTFDTLVCRDIDIGGTVEATVKSTGRVIIRAGAVFRGSITAPRLIVEEGATLAADLRIGKEFRSEG
jgi:cytoskeletal protein CcmA (bactofilin family)